VTGPDDADVGAFDDATDVDEDHDGMTSTGTSITTYGTLDLGESPRQAYVLVDGDSTFANGGIDDVAQARRQLGKGPALWFRQGDKRYVVRDPMLVQSLQRAYAGAAELGRQQGELGRQQSVLGRQQGELGRRQGELGRLQSEHARQIAQDAMRTARSAMAAHDINREAAAEAARAARDSVDDAALALECHLLPNLGIGNAGLELVTAKVVFGSGSIPHRLDPGACDLGRGSEAFQCS
jgi:hypothetical protein